MLTTHNLELVNVARGAEKPSAFVLELSVSLCRAAFATLRKPDRVNVAFAVFARGGQEGTVVEVVCIRSL